MWWRTQPCQILVHMVVCVGEGFDQTERCVILLIAGFFSYTVFVTVSFPLFHVEHPPLLVQAGNAQTLKVNAVAHMTWLHFLALCRCLHFLRVCILPCRVVFWISGCVPPHFRKGTSWRVRCRWESGLVTNRLSFPHACEESSKLEAMQVELYPLEQLTLHAQGRMNHSTSALPDSP